MDKMFDSSFGCGVSSFPHTDTSSRVVVFRVRLVELPLSSTRRFKTESTHRFVSSTRRLVSSILRLVVLRVRLITDHIGSSSFRHGVSSFRYGVSSFRLVHSKSNNPEIQPHHLIYAPLYLFKQVK